MKQNKMIKNRLIIFCLIIFFSLFVFSKISWAQELNYGDEIILDNDLDGLTDLGEKQLFGTDAQDPDSDGDGIYDGAEILSNTDPLNINDPSAKETVKVYQYPQDENILWPWYLSRSGGLVALLLLYLSIFFGLVIRFPYWRKAFPAKESLELHYWISSQAFFFVLIHALVLLWDKYISFNLADVFVPFASEFSPVLVTLGVLAMYLMLALILSSYFRKHMSFKIWRVIHFLNFFLYGFALYHAYYLGTDFKNLFMQQIFIITNGALVAFIFINLAFRMRTSIIRKRKINESLH